MPAHEEGSRSVRGRPIPFLVVALLMAGCGPISRPDAPLLSAQASEATSGRSVPAAYWEYPLGEAVQVPDVDAANLPYQADEPDELGRPVRILVTPIGSDPDAFREIAWVYSDSAYGRYVVLEKAVNLEGTRAHLVELAAGTPGCTVQTSSDGEITRDCNFALRTRLTLPNGWDAVLMVGDQTTFVKWVELASLTNPDAFSEYPDEFGQVGLEVEVIGPVAELTPEEAVSIASGV